MKKFRVIPYHHNPEHWEIVEEVQLENDHLFDTITTSDDVDKCDIVDKSGNLIQKREEPDHLPHGNMVFVLKEEKQSHEINMNNLTEFITSQKTNIDNLNAVINKITEKTDQWWASDNGLVEEAKGKTPEEKISIYRHLVYEAQEVVDASTVRLTLMSDRLDELNIQIAHWEAIAEAANT